MKLNRWKMIWIGAIVVCILGVGLFVTKYQTSPFMGWCIGVCTACMAIDVSVSKSK